MQLDTIKDDWKSLAGKYYYFFNGYSCDSLRFESGDLLQSFFGLPYISKRRFGSSYVDIICNSGARLLHLFFPSLPTIFTAFWCQGGKIGFATHTGRLTIAGMDCETLLQIDPPSSSQIQLCSVFFNGIAYITESGEFWVFDYSIQKYENFGNHNFDSRPLSLMFFRGITNFGIIALDNGKIIRVEQNSTFNIHQVNFTVKSIRNSPDGSYIALFGTDVCLVLTKDGKELLSFPIKNNIKSEWLSNTALIISSDESNKPVLCDINGDRVQLDFDSEIIFINNDNDHTRIYTKTGSVYIIAPVHQSILSLVHGLKSDQIRSLFLSFSQYESKDPKSFQTIHSIRDSLPEIVNSIFEAVTHIPNPNYQEILMKVASYAAKYVTNNEKITAGYVKTMHEIRLLNTLHAEEFGITTQSLREISPLSMLEFLIGFRHFGVAMKVCQLFGISESIVGDCWAKAMFAEHGEAALAEVLNKLSTISGTDYCMLTHYAKNRKFSSESLIKLCHCMPPKQRIDFLTTLIGTNPLDEAIELREGGSIVSQLCLKRMQMSALGFQKLLGSNEVVRNHYVLFKKYQDPEILKSIPHIRNLIPTLLLHENASRFGESKTQMRNLIKLGPPPMVLPYLEKQIKLIDIKREHFPGTDLATPRQMMSMAYQKGDDDLAKRIASLYGISKRTSSIIMMQTYAKEGMWDKFMGLKTVKCITLEEFAEACLQYNNLELAKCIIRKMQIEQAIAFCKQYKLRDMFAELNDGQQTI